MYYGPLRSVYGARIPSHTVDAALRPAAVGA